MQRTGCVNLWEIKIWRPTPVSEPAEHGGGAGGQDPSPRRSFQSTPLSPAIRMSSRRNLGDRASLG